MQNVISKAVISRLPRYYRYLGELLKSGIDRVSSDDLSQKMGVTASQIRQDFNKFGGFGHQGYGYNVEYLREEMGKILGIDKPHNIAIIGMGNIGNALVGSKDFETKNFIIKAVFDNNPDIVGKTIGGYKVYHIDKLKEILSKEEVEIAVIAVPKQFAKDIAEKVVEANVKGIWNFAHCDLDTPKNIVVENVHLADSLMHISYNLTQMK